MNNTYELRIVQNRDSWANIVNNLNIKSAYQIFAYGEAKRTQGWLPKRFVIKDNQKVVAAAQVLVRKIPKTCNTIGFLQFGPIIKEGLTKKEIISILTLIEDALIREHCVLLKVHGNSFWNLYRSNVKKASKNLMYVNSIKIDLTKDEETLFGELHKKLRNEIRKGKKNETIIVWEEKKEGIEQFYKLYKETYARTKSEVIPLEVFEAIYNQGTKFGDAVVSFAKVGNEVISGAIFLKTKQEWTYVWGASSSNLSYNKYEGQKVLLWENFLRAKEAGATTFDLGGVTVDAEPGTKKAGIYTFKSKFGGELVTFSDTQDVFLRPIFGRVAAKALDMYLK